MEEQNETPSRSGSVKRAREKAAAEERKRRKQFEKEYASQPAPLHVRRQRAENQEPPRSREQIPAGHSGYGPRTAMITPPPQQHHQQEANQQWPLPFQGHEGNGMGQQRQQYQDTTLREQQRQTQTQPYQDPRQAQGWPMMHQQQIHPSMRQAPFVQEHSAQVINGHPGHTSQGSCSQSREAESYLEDTSSISLSGMSNMATPGTDISAVSRDSQTSSTGTIPDFPAPTSMPSMKQSGLGPPPSARRGPPSFYSVNSAVTPITEETPKMPTPSAGFDPSTSYLADKTPEERGRREQSPTFFDNGISDDDEHIEQGIVRSASMGRRAKPAMVHQNRNSNTDKTQEGGVLGKTRALVGAGMIGVPAGSSAASKSQLAAAIQAGQSQGQSREGKVVQPPIPTIMHPGAGYGDTRWPSFGGDSPIENKELDMMSSSSESTLTPTPGAADHELKKLAPVALAAGAGAGAGTRHLSPTPSAQSLRSTGLGPGKEKDGLTAIGEIQYNRNSAIRRPPKLNLNAVRDAEARGSLTSLPDLIRRATKLASMMGEGKRPASRLNLNDFPMQESEKGSLAPNARLSGLSGMLAAFPPPGQPGANGTPLATPRSHSGWPGYASSTRGLRTPHGDSHPKPRRRCCGMPLWCFVLSLVVVLAVIAAAVVVPLKLTILKDKDEKPTIQGDTAIEVCQRDAACLNGGTSVLSGSSCGCICANGYEGARCDSLGTQGCTTVNYFGTDSGEKFEKITVGNAIPRLVDGSDLKFSIPLFYENLMNQFGKGEVSCSGANALVSFNGETGAEDEASSTTKSAAKSSVTAAPRSSEAAAAGGLEKRQDVDTEIALATGTETALGGKPTGYATSILVAPSAVPTGSSGGGGGARTGNITVSDETLDFARVAVLYVVQERSVDEALVAQDALIGVLSKVESEEGKKGNGTMPASNSMVSWSNAVGGTGFIDLSTWNVGMADKGGTNSKKVGGRGMDGQRMY